MKPHVCPVCTGAGTRPLRFNPRYAWLLANHTSGERCHACNGKGILWEPPAPREEQEHEQ